jgi:uncharacterized Ntn-hydrolase superfamily protein
MRRGTYSIVARDQRSGQLGVAVESHWFAVGNLVPRAEAGVGAVATQGFAEPAYGPDALAMLRDGNDARQALDRLTAADPDQHVRQVGVVDAAGGVAVHTGSSCVAEAGHTTGPGYCCQASMMLRDTVPAAMAAAYETADGSFAERLLAALDAAEAEGGDVRGRQSAALLVVPAEGEPWKRLFDLRVEDHPDPVAELRRLHSVQQAYDLTNEGENLAAAGRHEDAARLFEQALRIAPDNDELMFWAGLSAAEGGDMERALARVRAAVAINPRWAEVLGRLDDAVAPSSTRVRQALSEHERSS